MDASKYLIVILGFLLVVYVVGLFGPGPLIPGLGPPFDQFWGLAILAVLALVSVPWLVRTFRDARRGNGSSAHSSAGDILRERYARGELDRAEFLSMLNDVKDEFPPKI